MNFVEAISSFSCGFLTMTTYSGECSHVDYDASRNDVMSAAYGHCITRKGQQNYFVDCTSCTVDNLPQFLLRQATIQQLSLPQHFQPLLIHQLRCISTCHCHSLMFFNASKLICRTTQNLTNKMTTNKSRTDSCDNEVVSMKRRTIVWSLIHSSGMQSCFHKIAREENVRHCCKQTASSFTQRPYFSILFLHL